MADSSARPAEQLAGRPDPAAPKAEDASRPSGHDGRTTPGRHHRHTILAFATAGAILLAIVGWLIYGWLTAPMIRAGLHSWEDPTGDVLPVVVEIRRPADIAVRCELHAVDDRQVMVGQLDLDVPAGPDEHLRVAAQIPLEGDGIAPVLVGCRRA